MLLRDYSFLSNGEKSLSSPISEKSPHVLEGVSFISPRRYVIHLTGEICHSSHEGAVVEVEFDIFGLACNPDR